jgi:hypothetical protein
MRCLYLNMTDEKRVDNEPVSCTLCEVDPVEVQLICGHLICRSCLALWYLESVECPWCRAPLKDFTEILPPSIASPVIPSETESCEICLQSLAVSCRRCSTYSKYGHPIPEFNQCNCVKLSCECVYHRHCIGFFYLHVDNKDNLCPVCSE